MKNIMLPLFLSLGLHVQASPAASAKIFVSEEEAAPLKSGPGLKDVTDLVAAAVKDGKIKLGVNNGSMGGDPAPDNVKNLTLRYQADGKTAKISIAEGKTLNLHGADLKILQAFYGATLKAVKAEQETLVVPEGFVAEKIHLVDRNTEGSWVGLCFDNKGRIIVSDQGDKIFRLTLKDGQIAKSEKLAIPGMAQGLCWAFDSLYACVPYGPKIGLHRLQDLDDDGVFEKDEIILKFGNGGEHSTHGVIPSPDGKHLVLTGGNHVHLPDGVDLGSAGNWGEDRLFPQLQDPNGHAVGIKAPGGWVIEISPDGKERRLRSLGLRNAYDQAFTRDGELITYDSDMEWNMGTAWYRPTRILNLIPGGDHGWRTGNGEWPDYWPDSAGALMDIGPGSPTGVLSGVDARFPSRYRNSIFCFDWTFGRIYSLEMKRDGAGFKTEKSVLVSGKPLPLTDGAIGPDGALYFITGGRGLQSALYRLSYTGKEDCSLSPLPEPSAAVRKLHELRSSKDPAVLWSAIGDSDRLLRLTARIGLEGIPLDTWKALYQAEKNPAAVIEASLAWARLKGDKATLFDKLLSVDDKAFDESRRLAWNRALQLGCIRLGKPDDSEALIKRLEIDLGSPSPALRRESMSLLTWLGSPRILSQGINLLRSSVAVKNELDDDLLKNNGSYAGAIRGMQTNSPDSQGLHYAFCLSHCPGPWTESDVDTVFNWLAQAANRNGGNSYRGFVKAIAKDTQKNLKNELLARSEAILSKPAPAVARPVAQGPGRAWTLDEAVKETLDLSQADHANGQRLYAAAFCADCHTHGNVGGSAGPNLTQLANRASRKDILRDIIAPSEVVAELFQNQIITLKNGDTVVGRIVSSDDKEISLGLNPFDLSQKKVIARSDIASQKASPMSPMPPGMISALNPSELRDLMKFLTEAAPVEKPTTSLFNGKDLSGWEGDPTFWKVEDGCITGESSAEHPCKSSTWLALKDKEVGDFELTAQFRFLSDWGNSGIQFRSRIINAKSFHVGGYQADLEMGPNYAGILYDQDGRGILCNRGDKIDFDVSGKGSAVGKLEGVKDLKLEKGRWYSYRIVAKGAHLFAEIDGKRTFEVNDETTGKAVRSGILALQVHSGPAMKIQFKDLKLSEK